MTFKKSALSLPDSRTPATMKFAPNAPDVERCKPSRIFATYSGGAAPIPLTIPRPPASATAAANAGEAIFPMPACCNGTVHPSNSVNFVWSMPFPSDDENGFEPFSGVDGFLPNPVFLAATGLAESGRWGRDRHGLSLVSVLRYQRPQAMA